MTKKAFSFYRLLLISLVLFVLWSLWARNWYISSLRFAVAFVFEESQYDKIIYPQAINSIIIFVSLILAVGGLNLRKRITIILTGLSVLFVTHLAFTHYFTFAINRYSGSTPFFDLWQVVLGITAMALPLILWVLFVPESVSSVLPKGKTVYYPCPVCGKIKRGILAHIEAVHGIERKGTRDKRVIEFLNEYPELKGKFLSNNLKQVDASC